MVGLADGEKETRRGDARYVVVVGAGSDGRWVGMSGLDPFRCC